MRIFRYREDRLPIFVISSLFLLDVAVYAFVDHQALLASFMVVSWFCKAHICAWNHHHQHVPVFEVPALNRLLELMYGLQTGITSMTWVLHHSIGHHVNYLDQQKDESRWRGADGQPMGEWRYTLEVGLTAYPRAWEVSKRFPAHRRLFVAMGILTLVVAGALVVIRPLPALCVFVVPMVVNLFFTAWATYSHHTGKSTASHFVASNNILHKGYNVLTGNLGLHTAHHYKPGIHWSRLPDLHAQIASKIPPDCYLTPGLPWRLGQTTIDTEHGFVFARELTSESSTGG